MNPEQVVVHGFTVVDGGVMVEAPPGHAVITQTVCPGAGVQVEDFKNGNKRNKVLLPGPWLLLVVMRG